MGAQLLWSGKHPVAFPISCLFLIVGAVLFAGMVVLWVDSASEPFGKDCLVF